MKIFISSVLILLSTFSYGQFIKVDEKFQLEVKRIDHRSRLFQVHFKSYYITIPKDSKKIQFRIKAKSLTNNKDTFDPNKLFVLLHDKKVRVRSFDGDFSKLIDVEKDDKDSGTWYSYKPDIADTFKDYQIDGYKDIETCLDFGTKRKPNVKPIYFDYKEIKSNSFNVYFALPKDQIKGELYYGDIKLMDFELKK